MSNETIAVTVYTVVSSTIMVEIEKGLNHDQKCKLINDIALDVYDVDSDMGDVYEKVHDVRFAEMGDSEEFGYSEYSAVLGDNGEYILVEK